MGIDFSPRFHSTKRFAVNPSQNGFLLLREHHVRVDEFDEQESDLLVR